MNFGRLYRHELYKICHRKGFIVGLFCIFFVLAMEFGLVCVADEEAYVDGVRYRGLAAVKINRQITEEFAGMVTDGTIEEIVSRYGLPEKLSERGNGAYESNFLTLFVTGYFTDGNASFWLVREKPEEVYKIADTDLGEWQAQTGMTILLAYMRGWSVFVETIQMEWQAVAVFLLLCLSVVFAEEKQTKMQALIFTTREGRQKDTLAKYAAGFTLTIGVYLGVVLLTFAAVGMVYGFQGLSCVSAFLNMMGMAGPYFWGVRGLPIGGYLLRYLGLCLLGNLFFAAMAMWVSARVKSPMNAAVIMLALWVFPVFIRMFQVDGNALFRLFNFLMAGTPVLLTMDQLQDIWHGWFLPVGFAVVCMAGCLAGGYRRWLKKF